MYSDPDTRASADHETIASEPLNRSAALANTERTAKQILCDGDDRYRIPTASQRQALLVGFAMCGKALVGKAYDAVRVEGDVDLSSPEDIARRNNDLTIIEIKSTNQAKIGPDLAGYFFNITAAELIMAQTLKNQFRFVFINTVRCNWVELTYAELMGKMKAMYPAYHIKL